MRLTQEELHALLVERFGEDQSAWAWVCPSCGDVATVADFREALAAHPRTNRDGNATLASDIIGQECIGRTLGAIDRSIPKGQYRGRGCDWCAYGFIPGPWTIDIGDGKTMSSFPVAEPHEDDEAQRLGVPT